MSTRAATVADADAIAGIHVDSWRATYRGILPNSYLARLDPGYLAQQWRQRLRTQPDDVLVVCPPAGHVAGFARVTGCDDSPELVDFAGEITMLYLAPAAIGCGLGAELWRAATSELSRRGYRWLVLWVLAANRDARAFYRSRGLRPDGGRRVDRFRGQPVDVIRYAGALNPAVDLATLFGQLA